MRIENINIVVALTCHSPTMHGRGSAWTFSLLLVASTHKHLLATNDMRWVPNTAYLYRRDDETVFIIFSWLHICFLLADVLCGACLLGSRRNAFACGVGLRCVAQAFGKVDNSIQ